MPHVRMTKKGFKITTPDGKGTLAFVKGTGKKSRNKAVGIQRQLEGQRQRLLGGSPRAKISRRKGSFRELTAKQRRRLIG